EIETVRRQRLLEHKVAAIAGKAKTTFADLVNPDRQKVIASYSAALTLAGDPQRGAQAFTKHCAACHRLGSVGNTVGPDLGMTRENRVDWSRPAIFDPNQAVEAAYVNYPAVTKNGVILTGILKQESGNSLVLVGPDGKPQTLLRFNLDELVSSGKSFMPEGLE